MPFEKIPEGEYPDVHTKPPKEHTDVKSPSEGSEKSGGTEGSPLGPVTKTDSIRKNLESLAQSHQSSVNSYETHTSTDLVSKTRDYYKKTKDNIYTPIKALN